MKSFIETSQNNAQKKSDAGIPAFAGTSFKPEHAADIERYIEHLARHDRPMICTEWMARALDSRIADQLALYHRLRVGCFQWGLVRGRTQTYLPWPDDVLRAAGGSCVSDVWFHDILHRDGTPYDPAEIDTLARYGPAKRGDGNDVEG